ncbi:MAG: hypothetical protein IJ512_04065 [Ruminococcus sp.]|nr:hypothetical protein [Ruminococcus sp.]
MERRKHIAAVLCACLLTGCTNQTASHTEIPTVPPLATDGTEPSVMQTEPSSESSDAPAAEESERTLCRLVPVEFPEALTLPCAAVRNGQVYFCTSRTDAASFAGTAELYQLLPLENSQDKPYEPALYMPLFADAFAGVTAFSVLPEGGVCALVCGDTDASAALSPETYYEEPQRQWMLRLYDNTGAFVQETDLTALSSDGIQLTFSGITADAAGMICLTAVSDTRTELWVLDASGNLEKKIPADSFTAVSRIFTASDGRTLLFGQDDQYRTVLAELDPDADKLLPLHIWEEDPPLMLCSSSGQDAFCCLADETGICFWQGGQEEYVLFWEDTQLQGADVYWLEVLDDRTFAVLYTDSAGAAAAGILEILDKDQMFSELF